MPGAIRDNPAEILSKFPAVGNVPVKVRRRGWLSRYFYWLAPARDERAVGPAPRGVGAGIDGCTADVGFEALWWCPVLGSGVVSGCGAGGCGFSGGG